ncbi:MAG TPA: hypothetical protein DDZ89_04165 [Clostridiales bacterium]|nr:hypothetical protein [Clostridiales bacterium]
MSAKEVKSSKVSNKKGNKGSDPENIVRYTIYGISGVVAICLLLAVVFMIIPNTVATAGSEKITKDEFVFFHTQAINSYLQYNTDKLPVDEFLDQSLGEGLTFRNMAVAAATQQVHEYAIQYDLAKKKGLSLTQDEINSTVTSIRSLLEETANEYGVSINTISKANFGLPFRKVVKLYEKAMLGDKYANETVTNMQLSDEDYNAYYEENKESIDRVTARHILLGIAETDSEIKIKGLEDKANDILQKIKDGADFEALVKEHSTDTNSVEKGGKMTFTRNQMVKEFETFVFDNEPGTLGVVRTDYGFHIIEVMEHLFGYEANADIVKSRLPSIKYNKELSELKEGEYAITFRNSFGDIFD